MKLYSYIVATDKGFAPNPFFGYCTLACCKPRIRSSAKKGDWIIGLSGINKGNRVIFAMEVTEEPKSFTEYFLDKRFKNKIPDMNSKDLRRRNGDNIYEPVGNGFVQLPSMHYNNGDNKENIYHKKHDLGGKQVLISNRFYYYGQNMKELPKHLQFLLVKRNHRSNFDEKQIKLFLSSFTKQPSGVYGPPSHKYQKYQNNWSSLTVGCR